MLTIHSYPGTRGTRCTWAAEELGLEYEFSLVNLYKGEHKSPEYLAITPTGKVPAVTDGDVTIAESGAILSYLAQKAGKLIPSEGTPERAKFEEMMYFLLTELEQPLWTMAKHKFALPEDKRITEVIQLGAWEYKKALSVFEKMLGDSEYAAGQEFTVADIVAGHVLSWAKGFQMDINSDKVNQYFVRVTSRPSYLEAKRREADAKQAAGLA